MDWSWTPWEQLVAAVTATPFVFSPWAVAQVRELPAHPLLTGPSLDGCSIRPPERRRRS